MLIVRLFAGALAALISCPVLAAKDETILADQARVQALAKQVQRIPAEGEVAYQPFLRDLVQLLVNIGDPLKCDDSYHSRFWNKDAPVAAYFESQLLLFQTLWPAFTERAGELEGTNGPWDIGFRQKAPPPKFDLWLRLTHEYGKSGWSLFRDSLRNVHRIAKQKVSFHIFDDWSEHAIGRIPLSDRGLKDLLRGSQMGEALVEILPSYLNQEALQIDEAFLALVKRAMVVGDDDLGEIKKLNEDFDIILRRFAYLGQWADGLVRKWTLSLQDLTTTKRASSNSFADLSESVRLLGEGLRELRSRAAEFKVTRQWPRSFEPSSPFLLSDPYRDLASLWSLHQNFSYRPSLWYWPSILSDLNGEAAFEFYDQLLIAQYLFAAGVAISKITRTPEGRAGWGDLFSMGTSALVQKLLAPRASAPTSQIIPVGATLKMSALPSARLPLALRERRGEAEKTLWRIFFEAAGLGAESVQAIVSKNGVMSPLLSICEAATVQADAS